MSILNNPEYFTQLLNQTEHRPEFLGQVEILRKFKTIKDAVIGSSITPDWLYGIVLHGNKKRWTEIEPILMLDPEVAASYAFKIIKKRWPEAEPSILSSYESALFYAERVIRGRWPEAEVRLKNSAPWAYYYVRMLLKVDGQKPNLLLWLIRNIRKCILDTYLGKNNRRFDSFFPYQKFSLTIMS